MRIDDFLDRLEGVKGNQKTGWAARCPCRNDDTQPSLSVKVGKEGQILLKCHRGGGCDFNEICKATGVPPQDLWPEEPSDPKRLDRGELEKKSLKLQATYPYRDEAGTLLFEKRRYIDENGNKTFRTRRPDPDKPGEWLWRLDGTRAVLLNLPKVRAAVESGDDIYLVEGEKDATTLIQKGYVATTPPHGAGVWDEDHTESLRGAAHVFIIADADKPGRAHAQMVAAQLAKVGVPHSLWEAPPPHKDVSDLLAAGGTLEDLIEMRVIDESLPEPDPSDMIVVESPTLEPIGDPLALIADEATKILTATNLTVAERTARIELLLRRAAPGEASSTGRLVQWGAFVNEAEEEYDWLIPGLLERQERVIVVAAEGVGKTMLNRQVAICCAAGIQPFTQQPVPAIRTLSLDLENPERVIRRTTRELHARMRLYNGEKDIPAYLYTCPSGLDLLRAEDRAHFESVVEQVKPDLLVIGPLYKAFLDPGTRTSEAIAVEIAKYLDSVRVAFDCAMWIEHHAPLGSSMTTRDLRPFGSAVWSRWPEFGKTLSIDITAEESYVYNVGQFRGDRDLRHWPTKMKRGKSVPFEVIEFKNVQ